VADSHRAACIVVRLPAGAAHPSAPGCVAQSRSACSPCMAPAASSRGRSAPTWAAAAGRGSSSSARAAAWWRWRARSTTASLPAANSSRTRSGACWAPWRRSPARSTRAAMRRAARPPAARPLRASARVPAANFAVCSPQGYRRPREKILSWWLQVSSRPSRPRRLLPITCLACCSAHACARGVHSSQQQAAGSRSNTADGCV